MHDQASGGGGCGSVVVRIFGVGQNEGRWDVSLNADALIGKQTSGNGTTLIPTNNVGFLGTARFRFAKKSALEVNWGRAQTRRTTSLLRCSTAF